MRDGEWRMDGGRGNSLSWDLGFWVLGPGFFLALWVCFIYRPFEVVLWLWHLSGNTTLLTPPVRFCLVVTGVI
jgi:hypothetical protein